MISELGVLLFVGLFILAHEFGHYLAARHDGVYAGWGITPLGPCIRLTTNSFPRRIDCLSGIVASYASFPLFLFVFTMIPPPYPNPLLILLIFSVLAFGSGFVDLLMFIRGPEP